MYILSTFILKKEKKIIGRKERYRRKSVQNRYPVMKIVTAKTTTLRTLYVHVLHVVLNSVIFPQILYDIVLYTRHFLAVKFFPDYYSNKLNYRKI